MSDTGDIFNNSYDDNRLDTDLSGMDMESAKEYVFRFITSLKQLQRQIGTQEEELKTWQQRVDMATGRNREDLAAAARTKIDDINDKLSSLRYEEQDLAVKVRELLTNLKKLQHTGFIPTVNVDQLMAELGMIVGEKDTLAEEFEKESADAALEELKKKMQGDNQ